MASETSSVALPSSDSGKRTVVPALGPNEKATFIPAPGTTIVLNFNVDEASFSREGDSMVIHQGSGAEVVLQGLFAHGNNYPNFEELGGNVFTGIDFLSTLSPRLDAAVEPALDELVTAAGPQPRPATPTGGGVGEYREGAGALVESVQRMTADHDGSFLWDNSTLRFGDGEDTVGSVSRDISIITPFGSGPGGPVANEAGLPGGSGQESARFSGWHDMVLPEGVRVQGLENGGTLVLEGQFGQLTIRHAGANAYEYRYELREAYEHELGGEVRNLAVDADIITLNITDGSNTGTAQVAIDIRDDAPVVTVHQDSETVYSGYEALGQWNVHFGADGERGGGGLQIKITDESGATNIVPVTPDSMISVSVDGVHYGHITFWSDGTYIFSALGNITQSREQKLNIVLGATDSEGDFVEDRGGQGITLNIVKPPVEEIDPLGSGENEWFSEQNLTDGTAADAAQLTKAIAIPEGLTIYTSLGGWSDHGMQARWNGMPINGRVYTKTNSDADANHGTLTYIITDDGPLLFYTLEQTGTHSLQGVGKDDVVYGTVGKVTLYDNRGNLHEVDTRFTIYDDQPLVEVSADAESVTSGEEATGEWNVHFGADGEKSGGGLQIRITDESGKENVLAVTPDTPLIVSVGNVEYGEIVFKSDGSYVFRPAAEIIQKLKLVLGATDGDGDFVEHAGGKGITFDIKPPTEMPPLEPWFSDKHLPGGTEADAAQATKAIPLAEGYTIDTTVDGWVDQGWQNGWNGGSINGRVYTKTNADANANHGTLTYIVNDDGHSLFYTLEKAGAHSRPGVGKDDVVVGTVGKVTLLDAEGHIFTADTRFTIYDDQPLVEVSAVAKSVTSGKEAMGDWNVHFGADGEKNGGGLQIRITDESGKENVLTVTPNAPLIVSVGNVEYGEIVFKSDGSYVFRTDADITQKVTVVLGATDGDGDFVEHADGAGITFDIKPPTELPAFDPWFSDKHLPGGTEADAAQLTKAISLPEGYTIDTAVDGWVDQGWQNGWNGGSINGRVYTKTNADANANHGTLTYIVTEDGHNLFYTLEKAGAHSRPGVGTDDVVVGTVGKVTLTNGEGHTFTADTCFTIYDDQPVLQVTPDDGPVHSGYEATGEWNVHFGADKESSDGGLQIRITDESGKENVLPVTPDARLIVRVDNVEYGEIIFKSDGSYVFQPFANITQKVTVVLGATDGDGDFVEHGDGSGITFDIKPPPKEFEPLGSREDEWFTDQNIVPGGTAADSTQATKEILIPDGYTINTSMDGWVDQGWQESWKGNTINGHVYTKTNVDANANNGTLTYIVTEDGHRLTYTLEKAAAHSQQGVGREDAAYGTVGSVTLADVAGNFYEVGTRFTIYDDQPDVSMGGRGTAQSGKAYSGNWSVVYGGDGAASGDDCLSIAVTVVLKDSGESHIIRGSIKEGVPFSIKLGDLDFGLITLNADNTFEFTPRQNLEGTFSFVLTGRDADGDVVSSETLNVRVSKDVDPNLPEYLGDGVRLDEANLVESEKNPHNGTKPDEQALTQNIDIPEGYTVDTGSGWTEAEQGVWTKEGEFGFLTYELSGGSQKLSYTLTSAPQVSGAGKNATTDSIEISLLDDGLNNTDLPVKVSIIDDVPLVGFGSKGGTGDSIFMESGASYEGAWSVNYGADGSAPSDSLVLRVYEAVSGQTFSQAVTPGQDRIEVKIQDTTYGWMTLNEGGSYVFEAAIGVPGQLTFTLAAKDADGDESSSSSFSVTVNLPGGPEIPHLGHDKVFDEANFDNGTKGNTSLLTQTLEVPEGFRIDVSAEGWERQPTSNLYMLKGAKGYLTCSEDGRTLRYTLTDRVRNDGSDPVEHSNLKGYDVIPNIRLLNDNNYPHYLNARIEILDDRPDLYFSDGMTYDVFSGKEVVSGKDGYTLKFGADGSAEQGEQPLMLYASVGNQQAEPISIPPGGSRIVTVGGVTYGTLFLDDGGGFSFKAAANIGGDGPVRLKLALMAKDLDGDTASTQLDPVTIVITKPAGPPSEYYIGGNGEFFEEADLPLGSAQDKGSLVKNLTIYDGYYVDTKGWNEESDGVFTLKSDDNCGYLTYTLKTNVLTYTLVKAAAHSGPGSAHDLSIDDVFQGVKLRDADGNTYDVNTRIDIRDDNPIVEIVSGGSVELGGLDFDFSTSGVLDVTFGADGDGGGSGIAVEVSFAPIRGGITGEQGTVKLDVPKDGSKVEFATALGEGTLRYDAATQKLYYEYTALRGQRGDIEQLGFGAMDGDGDYGTAAEMRFTLNESVPSVVFQLDEGGLEMGSRADGHGPAEFSASIPASELAGDTVTIQWDIDSIPEIRADGDLDGVYSLVEWRTEGEKLCGYAEDQLVAEISPKFEGDVFTGELSAAIYRPFQHSLHGTAEDKLPILVNFTQENAEGQKTHSAVALVVKDDMPFGNTGEGGSLGNTTSFSTNESGVHREDVYLVVDISGSINKDQMVQQIQAIRELAETYKQNGIDAVFTVIPFGAGSPGAQVRLDGVSYETLMEELPADDSGDQFLRGSLGQGTNYTVSLDLLAKQLAASQSHETKRFMEQKVFFLSDGAQTSHIDKFLDSWVPFREANDFFEVFALGVGPEFADKNSNAYKALGDVTGKAENVVAVDDFESLKDGLSNLIKPELGNILEAVASADKSLITAIWFKVDGVEYPLLLTETDSATGLKHTGKADLGKGISIVLYENGDFQLTTLENIEQDLTLQVKLTVSDADGDAFTSDYLDFVIKDHVPVAYHKEAEYNPGYGTVEVFGTFVDRRAAPKEGWESHNSSWREWLPENMLPYPPDLDLLPYMTHSSLQLTAAQNMGTLAVKDYIGQDNSLTDVLNEIGIETSHFLVSNNNVSSVALAGKEFTSKGGEIVFNWSFSGKNWEGEADAAFWILLDGDGNIVSSGKVAAFEESRDAVQYLSGVTRVAVPDSSSAKDYKLVIGSVDGGEVSTESATLNLNTLVLMEDKHHFAGNLLTDASPGGDTDVLYDKAGIEYVMYGDERYFFGDEGTLFIEMGSGDFILNKGGDYTFTANGASPGLVDETLTYYLADQDGDTASANLLIRGEIPSGRGRMAAEGYALEADRSDTIEDGGQESMPGELYASGQDTPGVGEDIEEPRALVVDELLDTDMGQPEVPSGMQGETSLAGGESQKLSFSSLLEAEQSLEDYLGEHVRNLSLDTDSDILSFEIVDEGSSKEVAIQFTPADDAAYMDVRASYLGEGDENAQHEILAQFLLSISSQ